MGTQPYWTRDPKAWNQVTLGDVTLPGYCSVMVKKGRALDVKKAKGQDGATMTDEGLEPGKVVISVLIAHERDWDLWQVVRPRLDPMRPGGSRTPLGIIHPAAQEAGIQNIYVKEISAFPPSAKNGRQITLDCVEWFPAPKPVKKAAGVGTSKTKAKPAAPNFRDDPKDLAREMQRRQGVLSDRDRTLDDVMALNNESLLANLLGPQKYP